MSRRRTNGNTVGVQSDVDLTSGDQPNAQHSDGPAHPRVSVCIPLYEKADYVARTIDSVLSQTFTDFELVVLDNASTDGSAEVVDRYDDPRLRVVRNAETLPMIENFDATVRETRAPLVKLLNADDLVEPEALARQVAVMDAEPGVAFVGSRHHLVDDDGRVVAPDRMLATPDLIGRQDRAAVVRRVVRHGGNPLGAPGNMLFRRTAFDAIGGFPTYDSYVLDVALAVRLTIVGDFYGLPETLARFRLAVDSEGAADRWRNLRVQRDFVRRLQREHADVVRRRDILAGTARWPLTWLHDQVAMSASSDPDSWTHRVTARVLRSGAHHPPIAPPGGAPPHSIPPEE
jgi:glycosyltransferase involved in cell wall biosynthesis